LGFSREQRPLWIIWGWHDTAYALVTLQIALAAMNIRGVMKT